jgi:hypothetical protein
MKGKKHRHLPPEPSKPKSELEFKGSLAEQDAQRSEKENAVFAKAAAIVGEEHIEKKPPKTRSAGEAPGPRKVQAELAAIGHVLDKNAGRMLAIGVKFDLDRETADSMHHAIRDAFDMISEEECVKRISIDSKEWPAHAVKFYDTPDLPPGLQLQDATIRNVVVSRFTKKNESRRVLRFDVVAPASACGQWPQNHYRADVWLDRKSVV